MGDTKAQEIGYMGAVPEFEPGLRLLGTEVTAMSD